MLSRTAHPIENRTDTLCSQHTGCNRWITTPAAEGVVPLNTRIHCGLGEQMINFLFRPSRIYIDYRPAGGRVASYRFLPYNADNGLWVSTHILANDTYKSQHEVAAIQFRSVNKTNANIEASWIEITGLEKSWLLEKPIKEEWPNIPTPGFPHETLKPLDGVSEKIAPEGFSSTVKISMDSTSYQELVISTWAWIQEPNTGVQKVIPMDGAKPNYYQNKFAHNPEAPKSYEGSFETLSPREGHYLRIYLWNNGDSEEKFDQFFVSLSEKN